MLCRTLGHGRWTHPDEMLDDMPARWFEDWQAAYGLDPWGEERADLRAARISWAALQPHSKRRLRERDFVLKFNGPRLVTGPAAYRQRAMQRYGMLVAHYERQEQRLLSAPSENVGG